MAFHPYPQVIPSVFNRSGFGPPQSLTSASACPWIDHPASRLRLATDRHLKGSLSLRLGSRLNLAANRNSLAHSTKGTPSHREGCSGCLGAHGFRCSFTPLSGCFSPFPHGTGSLSVIGECLALEGGPPRFIPGFTCPALLGIPLSGPRSFGYGALTLFRPASQPVPLDRGFLTRPRRSSDGTEGPTTPRAATPGGLHAHGFRLLRFRSPLLAQSRLISFPPGT